MKLNSDSVRDSIFDILESEYSLILRGEKEDAELKKYIYNIADIFDEQLSYDILTWLAFVVDTNMAKELRRFLRQKINSSPLSSDGLERGTTDAEAGSSSLSGGTKKL